MRKKEKINWKDVFIEIFGELAIYLIIIIIGLFGVWILPFDLPSDLDFELVLFIGCVVLLPIIILIGYIVYFVKAGYKMKDFKYIKNKLKKKYELVLTTTMKMVDNKEHLMPLLIGKNKEGKFRLIQDRDKLIFYIEYDINTEKENITLYPANILEAISIIEKFMEES